MFRANYEDERTPTGHDDPSDKEKRMDKRQAKKEREEEKERSLRHIKVRAHHMGLNKPEEDDGDEGDKKFKPRDSPSEPTIPSGAGGFLTSLGAQAKGPGAAGGEMIQMSEPMEHAWSSLLKQSRAQKKRRKKEQYAKWRPSTGQFKRPRGGYSGRSGTSARAKNLSRHLPMGKKTGLMRPHLAVEMSHRGIASKQPMSKDPQAYGAYRGYQEAQKIQGGVPSRLSRRAPFGQLNAPSGRVFGIRAPKPRLKPHRAPPIQPPRMRTPHLNRPKMPGMVTMSEDEVQGSDLLKRDMNHYLLAELRTSLKELQDLMRRKKDKDRKSKGMGTPDTAGGASTLPNYPGNNPKQTTNPTGATESQEDARQYGLDPRALAGRGSGRA
tara:strand:+ start:8263 stop:9405 length:1143 start_codon:yes stop_codon:yes gene_type:complete